MSPPPGGIVNARAVEINFGRRIKPPDLFLNRFQLLRFKPHEGKVPKNSIAVNSPAANQKFGKQTRRRPPSKFLRGLIQ
jgi:hypothetical protein